MLGASTEAINSTAAKKWVAKMASITLIWPTYNIEHNICKKIFKNNIKEIFSSLIEKVASASLCDFVRKAYNQ